MSLVDPVDNTLEVHTQHSTNTAKAHAFQVQSNRGFFEGGVVAHWFRIGSEIAFTVFTSHTHGTSAV